MLPVETMLGKLGSRFTLHFPRTSEKRFFMGPLGKYYDRPWELTLGVRARRPGSTEEIIRVLPYTSSAPHFTEVEQELTMNSVRWRARDRETGLRATFTITAPFYPRDIKLCTAPFFYIDAEVSAPADYTLELVVGLADPAGEAVPTVRGKPSDFENFRAMLEADYKMVPGHWGPRHPQDSYSAGKTFTAPVALSFLKPPEAGEFQVITERAGKQILELRAGSPEPGKSGGKVNASFVLATFIEEPVLEVREESYRFKYLDFFKNIGEVIQYARESEAEIRRKSALFDWLFSESSLGATTCNLLAFSFQSYIPNTWWATALKDGRDWYSVWEGNCTFHSTVDVEYNLAWFYLLLWPELLEMTLAEWREHLKPSGGNVAWMSHDIGALLGANQQAYPHEMEVEESANFILLAYALWRYTANSGVPTDNREAITKLARYILDSATTGSGFPTEGTANTVDDASPAVQFGREQTYLAVKALGALHAASLILAGTAPELATECWERVALISRTLDKQAWLGDHYAVCLDQTTDGLVNPWSGEPLPPGELSGWNAYSLYTSNGLLYLLATGTPLPFINEDRFRQDILNARRESLTEYGCTHSSADHSHIWISQNLHRDHTGAFLGVDPDDLPERYWAFEQFENSVGRGGCFVDTYGSNHLRYYPRGITALGLLASLPGMKLDQVQNLLEFDPVRVPLRVPLLALADWEQEKVPWVEFEIQDGKVRRKE